VRRHLPDDPLEYAGLGLGAGIAHALAARASFWLAVKRWPFPIEASA
jgi:hypothetical protein